MTESDVTSDPIHRFSSRVDNYVRYRPSYPPAIIPLLEHTCGLTSQFIVADVGSGTGLLSALFLEFGCRVIGVEPNPDMRQAGASSLANFANFQSIQGRAEETGLPAATVDLIVAGQAFHWFDPERSAMEFRRILRFPGWVSLIWNERRVTSDGFLAGYEALLNRYAPEYQTVDHRRIDSDAMTQFFGHSGWRKLVFPNSQEFDLAGVRGRLLSSSYAPPSGTENHEPMMEELDRLFESTATDGKIHFLYDTIAYVGTLSH